MPAVLDENAIPTCCGYRLEPVFPMCQCAFCGKTYDVLELRRLMAEKRQFDIHHGDKP